MGTWNGLLFVSLVAVLETTQQGAIDVHNLLIFMYGMSEKKDASQVALTTDPMKADSWALLAPVGYTKRGKRTEDADREQNEDADKREDKASEEHAVSITKEQEENATEEEEGNGTREQEENAAGELEENRHPVDLGLQQPLTGGCKCDWELDPANEALGPGADQRVPQWDHAEFCVPTQGGDDKGGSEEQGGGWGVDDRREWTEDADREQKEDTDKQEDKATDGARGERHQRTGGERNRRGGRRRRLRTRRKRRRGVGGVQARRRAEERSGRGRSRSGPRKNQPNRGTRRIQERRPRTQLPR
ncbi:hypothetical protein NDU88_001159 [Pleurodeles waltl]|uniref:Uncharacterized protein n=1 Tax=Pleurodeles waltl TaxID=8319 RepID=A0AAV7LZP3_PLEWA|nr:hypothetical protein NDU88_001159 [Pleurodeles waltl]